jgi:hypothetical protein
MREQLTIRHLFKSYEKILWNPYNEMTKLWGCCGVPSAGLPHTSLTCSRCRSYVELTPLPPKPVEKEPSPELTMNCEPDGETDGFNISVCPE